MGAKDSLYTIGSILSARNYNRCFLPGVSGERELTPVEFVFLAVFEFWVQESINGFSGFLANTDGQYLEFIPIALAAVGAPRSAEVVREWLSGSDPVRRDCEFGDLGENYGSLLVAYYEAHRRELPDPKEAESPRFREMEDLRKGWWEERCRADKAVRGLGPETIPKGRYYHEVMVSAVESGDVNLVRDLLDRYPTLVRTGKTRTGESLLHLAAKGCHVEVVRLLIDRGADVNAVAMERVTPLTAALRSGGLVRAGADSPGLEAIVEMIRKAGGE